MQAQIAVPFPAHAAALLPANLQHLQKRNEKKMEGAGGRQFGGSVPKNYHGHACARLFAFARMKTYGGFPSRLPFFVF